MNERLVLQDLIDILAKKQDITKKDAELFLRELVAVISETIEANDSVKIKDLGTFKLVKVNARRSVDVNTGEAIEIPAHYKLSFTPDKLLKEAVNRPFAHFETVILEEGVTFENIETEEDISDEENEEEKKEIPVAEEINEEIVIVDQDIKEETIIDKEPEPEIYEAILPVLEPEEPTTIDEEDTETEILEDEIIEEKLEIEEDDIVEEISDIADEIIIPEIDMDDDEISPIDEEMPEELTPVDILDEDEDNEEVATKSTDDESQNFTHQKGLKPSVAVKIDTSFEDEILHEEEEQKTKRKKYITIGFIALVVIAALIVGGSYFQRLTGFLDRAISDEGNKVRYDYTGLPADSLWTDSVASVDSLTEIQPVVGQQNAEIEDAPKADVKEASTQADPNKPLAIETLQAGQTMRLISLKHYGHRSFWPYIYEENKDKIKNPNSIPIGTKLIIPSPAKYGIDPKDKASIDKAKAMESKIVTTLGL
ncbi:MAG: HU family DNA-binding protein [Prevotella sp.]|jgi:nucleoid DNA-binding protein|nr:HU family DNA-binding protein [Prevotella sp.]